MRPTPLVLAVAFALSLSCAHGNGKRAHEMQSVRKELAQQLVKRGDWNGALELAVALYRQDPTDPEVLALRGVIFREQGLLREAEVELEEALRRRPDYAPAHAALGVLLDQAGRAERAAVHHQRAVALEPGNPAYLNNLAFSWFALGRLDEAIAHYGRALRIEPSNARIRNNLGYAYARSGDFALAAEQFSRAGTQTEAINNLGYAHELAGDLTRAFDLYLEATRLEPGSQRAKSNLDHLAKRLGRPLPGAPGAHERPTTSMEVEQ
jgi:Flp pilus assembly protein TadD